MLECKQAATGTAAVKCSEECLSECYKPLRLITMGVCPTRAIHFLVCQHCASCQLRWNAPAQVMIAGYFCIGLQV